MHHGLSFFVNFRRRIEYCYRIIVELMDERLHASTWAFIDNLQAQPVGTLASTTHDLVCHGFGETGMRMFKV